MTNLFIGETYEWCFAGITSTLTIVELLSPRGHDRRVAIAMMVFDSAGDWAPGELLYLYKSNFAQMTRIG